MAMERFEAGTTPQFTWTASVAPDAAPSFAVLDATETLLASMTALSSSSTQYYGLFETSPTSLGIYVAEWKATKTVNGSAWPFVTRQLFRVDQTRAYD